MADYKKEIEQILHKVFLSLHLDELYSFEDFVTEMLSETKTSYEDMSREIEIGIKNGAPLEFQLMMMEAYLTK